jgi:methanogenic corrinoid protein MtbC1
MPLANPEIEELSIQLAEALLALDRLTAKEILTRPYPNITSYQIVEDLVVPALEAIGAGWETGDYSLSQVYMSGRICEEIVDLILPSNDPARLSQPKMAIAVLEDYHLLGKRIVYSVMRASGFELLNYGRMDVAALIKRTLQDDIKILLVSTLMLPSALRIHDLRIGLDEMGSKVKIIVGGAPFRLDKQLWREVGADAVGSTAVEAVDIVRRMIEEIS